MRLFKGSGYVRYYKQTTNNTPFVLVSLPVATDTAYNLNLAWEAYKTNGDKAFVGELVDGFKNNGGTLTRINSDFQNDLNWQSDDGYTIATGKSGTNITVTITGGDGETLNWHIKRYKL